MMQDISTIPFKKMQGAGNDFVVLNNFDQKFSRPKLIELTPKICQRKFGVGSDGLLALDPPENKGDDYYMFYRNPDGSEAGMCGNGARCLAVFAYMNGFDKQQRFSINDTQYQASIEDRQTVRIKFPLSTAVEELEIEGQSMLQVYAGTEHIALSVARETLEKEKQLIQQGRKLRYHEAFKPKGTNVNFLFGIDKRNLQLQTYERGVENMTLACGTGAIASALAWHHLQVGEPGPSPFTVSVKGGELRVYFTFDAHNQRYEDIALEGPAQTVFEGTFFI